MHKRKCGGIQVDFSPLIKVTRNRVQLTAPITARPRQQPMVGRRRRNRRQRSEWIWRRSHVHTKYKQKRATSKNGTPGFIRGDVRTSPKLFFPSWGSVSWLPAFFLAAYLPLMSLKELNILLSRGLGHHQPSSLYSRCFRWWAFIWNREHYLMEFSWQSLYAAQGSLTCLLSHQLPTWTSKKISLCTNEFSVLRVPACERFWKGFSYYISLMWLLLTIIEVYHSGIVVLWSCLELPTLAWSFGCGELFNTNCRRM